MSLSPFTAFCWVQTYNPQSQLIAMIFIAFAGQGFIYQPSDLVTALQSLPEGQRVVFLWGGGAPGSCGLWGQAGDYISGAYSSSSSSYQSPWLVNGVTVMSAWLTPFIVAAKSAGTTIDFMCQDDETSLQMWNISQQQIDAIAADSRWTTFFNTQLTWDGLLFNTQWVEPYTSEVNTSLINYLEWNAAMDSIMASYRKQASYDILISYFPNASYSNISDYIALYNIITLNYPVQPPIAMFDSNGHPQFSVPPISGNIQSPFIYAQPAQIEFPWRNDGTLMSSDNFYTPADPQYYYSCLDNNSSSSSCIVNSGYSWISPAPLYMATLAWEVQSARNIGSYSSVVIPWISSKSTTAFAGSGYYEEMLRHICLCSQTTNFLFFNPHETGGATLDDETVLQNTLIELESKIAPNGTYQCITTSPIPFDSTTIISGIRFSSGNELYRITLSPGVTSEVVTLPNGNIITVNVDSSGVGMWYFIAGVVPPIFTAMSFGVNCSG